nr:unnamed protein product [Callosobruchus chinensis]CAH7769364.1 unnamed protein product [Callosobruchus chinensis]
MAAGISALAIPLNEQYVITRQIRFDSCPIDDFLFGKSFPDQLKSSKETQRLGYTIKKQQKVAHFMSPKTDITKKTSQPRVGPSGMPNSLNFRRSQFRSRTKKEEGRSRSRGA